MLIMTRHLILILGDQLWLENPALANFDPALDHIVMIESMGESSAVAWSHKARTALFLSAMRHFAQTLTAKGYPLTYLNLSDLPDTPELLTRLDIVAAQHAPQQIHCCEPGEYRLQQGLRERGVLLHLDTHFMCTIPEFKLWADGYKSSLRMEFFYRKMRAKHGILMQPDGKTPVGEQWNFDAENRSAYPKTGPGTIASPAWFAPDAISQQVFHDVETLLPNNPGSLDSFGWAVTREQALTALETFIKQRLIKFGDYQDAMWTGTPWGWHSLISTSLNLHLLDPREVIAAAENAYRSGHATLASVEGFIRQVLGWREFIRGVYWRGMPGMASANHFKHTRPLPAWYWTGDTHMRCMADALGQTLEHGYAHHIQRLMVTGQFALLAEVEPQQVAAWYLGVYVDAIEWVELPNVAGMALYADGGAFTSKPYIASGQYIKRQSNYCTGCRYKPDVRTGPQACPVSALYWRHLDKHHAVLLKNPRTALMAKSIERLGEEERQAIRDFSTGLLERMDDV
jgi:deoxyribodipyrimidine photolyase-related protein